MGSGYIRVPECCRGVGGLWGGDEGADSLHWGELVTQLWVGEVRRAGPYKGWGGLCGPLWTPGSPGGQLVKGVGAGVKMPI